MMLSTRRHADPCAPRSFFFFCGGRSVFAEASYPPLPIQEKKKKKKIKFFFSWNAKQLWYIYSQIKKNKQTKKKNKQKKRQKNMSFEAEKADIKTELHFSKLAMLCRFKSSMIRVKWAMLCRRFPDSRKCHSGKKYDYVGSHCQNVAPEQSGPFSEVLQGSSTSQLEEESSGIGTDNTGKERVAVNPFSSTAEKRTAERKVEQPRTNDNKPAKIVFKTQPVGKESNPSKKPSVSNASQKTKRSEVKANPPKRTPPPTETDASGRKKKFPQPVLCELLSALQALEKFYFDLYLAFSGQTETGGREDIFQKGHSSTLAADTLSGSSTSSSSSSLPNNGGGPRFVLRSHLSSETSQQPPTAVLAGDSLAFNGNAQGSVHSRKTEFDRPSSRSMGYSGRNEPSGVTEGVSAKLLRIVRFLSTALLSAVENEMFAMYILLTIANEDAAKKNSIEQQNAVVISLAKWYKEANLTDVLQLLAKTIEYAVTGEYIRNPVLLELPFDHCASQVQIRDVEIPHQLLFRVQFAGKTGEDACFAFKHVLAFHMSLATSVQMIKGSIDAKLLQCDCQSMGSYCRCSPRDFAPAEERVLGGMEDVLEGNCMVSCCY
jgi:hypothetical protein